MKEKPLKAVTAIEEAQKIAFAPFVFQTTVTLRDLGVLDYIFNHKNSKAHNCDVGMFKMRRK